MKQSSGDRIYFDKFVVKLSTVEKLKLDMITYPESTPDRDEEFLYNLSVAVFSLDEVKKFLSNGNLLAFDADKLKFVQGNNIFSIFHFLSFVN